MGEILVQGVVNGAGEALVQFRQIGPGGEIVGWQQGVDEARDHARLVLEAAANATYEAAFIAFARTDLELGESELMAIVGGFRQYRRDTWGERAIEDWRQLPDGYHRRPEEDA